MSPRASARRGGRILLLTPPLLQVNSPYPATMQLAGYLESRGLAVEQRDLSIKVVRDILLRYGDATTDELLELLAGAAPESAKRGASALIEELALRIRDEIDPEFGFSRYAEARCRAVTRFAELEKLVRRRGVIDAPLERHLKAAVDEVRPTVIGVTCPFPGTLVAAFKIARYVRRRYPGVRLALGGGYVSTELRGLGEGRWRRYFDVLQFDEGYLETARLVAGPSFRSTVPPFVRPSYRGIDWSEYFDVVETANPVANLWNSGRWVKLTMARGCYWHRCAFCDVRLPYVGEFRMSSAKAVVDAMEALGLESQGMGNRFHFVDEAMPPALVRAVAQEILRRGYRCEWWGNVRFDRAFTPALAKLMAKSGCIAVTGALECANDRLLKLMNKGITLASAERVLAGFRAAGIGVHAYLMYGFPTETRSEEREAERYVKGLAKRGLVQSAFWHRFALTVHSPIAAHPEDFGLEVIPPDSDFAVNELGYRVRSRGRRLVRALALVFAGLAFSLATAAEIITAQPLVNDDEVLEPSVRNEVMHAIDRGESQATNRFSVVGDGLVDELLGGKTKLTESAVRLVSLQRPDGGWSVNGTNVTAAVIRRLKGMIGETDEPPVPTAVPQKENSAAESPR